MATSIPPSFEDLLGQGKAEAQIRRPDLKFADGDVSEAHLHAAAAMADAVLAIVAQRFKNTFFDGARGDDLAILVDDRLGFSRKPATKASVLLVFSRPTTSTAGAGTIPSGTKVATAAGADGSQVSFTTDVPIAVPSPAALLAAGINTQSVVVNATCTIAGAGGNVIAGKIIQITSSLFDTFTVTNAASAGGGNDEETDDELRDRAKAMHQTMRRATLPALEVGALQIASVRSARAFEDELGHVTLRVADGSGGSSQRMLEDVEREIVQWRAAGVPVAVVGGKRGLVTISLSIYGFAETFDIPSNKATVQAAVQAKVNRLKPGETLYLDSVVAAVIAVAPTQIFGVTIEAVTLDGVAQGPPIADLKPADAAITLRINSLSDVTVA